MANLRENIAKEDYVSILIGNKVDLGGDREVSEDKGKNFAQAQGFFFMETSAKMSVNVSEAFNVVIKNVFDSLTKYDK